MISSQDLRDIGFTLLESNYGSATYKFPDHLDHGGYKLVVQDSHPNDPVAREQTFNVIDPNGIWQPQLVPDISHLYFFMEQFPKK